MGSPPGIEKIDWYATPELQVVLCFCGVIHKDLKKKHGKVKESQFWKTLFHHIPYVADLVPGEPETLVNRLVQRGDKLNRISSEHPTHPTKRNLTGRFWERVNERYNGPKGEQTLRKEELECIISECSNETYRLPLEITEFAMELPPELEKFIDLNELLERIEYLEENSNIRALEARITALENLFKRR